MLTVPAVHRISTFFLFFVTTFWPRVSSKSFMSVWLWKQGRPVYPKQKRKKEMHQMTCKIYTTCNTFWAQLSHKISAWSRIKRAAEHSKWVISRWKRWTDFRSQYSLEDIKHPTRLFFYRNYSLVYIDRRYNGSKTWLATIRLLWKETGCTHRESRNIFAQSTFHLFTCKIKNVFFLLCNWM